jgi:hypothetical protein
MTTTAKPTSEKALQAVLVILGAISAFVAVNVAFGGLETLGRVTDQDAYLIRDSHAHYYGGVYLALGLFLIYAARDVRRFRPTLNVVFAMIFAGGLARLTQLEPDVTFGGDLMVSTVIELIGIPLLAWWVNRSARPAGHAAPPIPQPAAA